MLGGTPGPFSSVLARLASHRLAKLSTRLDPTTVCAVQPEGHCNPLDDGFAKLERLEAAWAAREKNESAAYESSRQSVVKA